MFTRKPGSMNRLSLAALPVLMMLAGAAQANDRGYSISDFDRIRVIGPFTVEVETGKAPSAKATGSAEALERVSVSVQGRMLIIKSNGSAWGGWPGKTYKPALVKITVPMLRTASLEGAGDLAITRLRAERLTLGITGSGRLSVASLETDKLDINLLGAGSATFAGNAKQAMAYGRGAASMDAAGLTADHLALTWQSAGNAKINAKSTAKIASTGAGNVVVTGKAACTVNAVGAGNVSCGE